MVTSDTKIRILTQIHNFRHTKTDGGGIISDYLSQMKIHFKDTLTNKQDLNGLDRSASGSLDQGSKV